MAGEYIEFDNNSQPAINDTNLNLLQQLIKQDIQGAVAGDTLPVGAIMPFGSNTIPENWLLCDGSAVSRTDYEQLFNTIGTTFGIGDGFTTFNLPNLKGRIPVGKDTNDTDFDVLGETGGEKAHTLIINEMPSHNHTFNFRTSGTQALSGDHGAYMLAGTDSTAIANTGGGQAHNNLQPYIVTNYIIKTTQSAGIIATVVDNLLSTSTTDALSANQGRAIKELLEGTVLYNNSEGISTGDIVLSEDMTNYQRLVFYSTVGEWLGEMLTNATQGILQQNDQGSINTIFKIARLTITNDTTLTFFSNKRTYYNGSTWSQDTTGVLVGEIVGYKY